MASKVCGKCCAPKHALPASRSKLKRSLFVEAMAGGIVLILAVLGIVPHPLKVGDQIDLATQQRMQQREEQLRQEMIRLQQELDKMTQKLQSRLFLKNMLLAMWEVWPFGALPGALVLLFELFWMATEVDSDESESSSDESSSSSEEEEEAPVNEWDVGRFLMQQMQVPVLHLAKRCKVVEALVGDLLHACHLITLNTPLLRLEQCIGVGSAFEGWSSHWDTVYSLLVPLKPPTGHCFHLELGAGGELPARHGRVRVELECVCLRQQLLGDVRCFLHRPEAELGRNQGPCLLQYLCSHSYLDVEKTACWFQLTAMNAWLLLPASHRCRLTVLPSSRSCKLRLEKVSGRSLSIEILFGVQQGDSRVFLTSQQARAGLPSSTTWLESCAVPEMLFFRFVARQAPQDSCHLTCLNLFARLLEGTGFSTYCLKTVLMHLLTVIPLSRWHRGHLLERVDGILQYLQRCLEDKQLHHFLLGNERVPREVPLPVAFQTASPLNLFQRLAQEPDAHAQALRDFRRLQVRLRSLL
ncbi:inositol 1,4,5-trisphosphate receptor-interacting protein-like 1 [Apteryx mantelli]|uniref:Inositol 1,4,5-trisphosphate receptor-interacting protein-like 1 n=1 Tax=Apteryx mantelli TaxID=2696672 RepID=A0ABM4EGG8_9AVES